jgi:hypothetical protein
MAVVHSCTCVEGVPGFSPLPPVCCCELLGAVYLAMCCCELLGAVYLAMNAPVSVSAACKQRAHMRPCFDGHYGCLGLPRVALLACSWRVYIMYPGQRLPDLASGGFYYMQRAKWGSERM